MFKNTLGFVLRKRRMKEYNIMNVKFLFYKSDTTHRIRSFSFFFINCFTIAMHLSKNDPAL